MARGISKWESYSRAEHQTKMTIEQVKNFSNWDLCLPDENPRLTDVPSGNTRETLVPSKMVQYQ